MKGKTKTATKEVKLWKQGEEEFKKQVERKMEKAEIKMEKRNKNDTKISSGRRNEYMDEEKGRRMGETYKRELKSQKHVYIHNT
jgi:hypothetical protein